MKKDHMTGYINGLKHDINSVLHRDNLLKCRTGQKSDNESVRDYWSGYGLALDNLRIPTLAGGFKIMKKYFVIVALPSGCPSILTHRDKTQFCKRTAKKHCAEMIARGYIAHIEEV